MLEVEGTAVIELDALVTITGADTQLYRVEQIVQLERRLIRVRAVSTGKSKYVDVEDIVIVAELNFTALQETAKAKASEAEHDTVGDDIGDEHYAIELSRYDAIKKFQAKELTQEEVCATLGIGKSTFYKLLKKQELVRGIRHGNSRASYCHPDSGSLASDIPRNGDAGAPDLPDDEVGDDR